MEKENVNTASQEQKITLDSLSKEEIIGKYKGLLLIAKKAKQAKDEISEETRSLKEQLVEYETQKEADKKTLNTMKELLDAYTESKLKLTTQNVDLQKLRKLDCENLERIEIENESMKRQLQRLTDDNESLLKDVENMEKQLQQVSDFGKKQKQQLDLLEKENAKLKEIEIKNHETQLHNNELNSELQELKEKYKFIKDINSEQRLKFNSLKDRFIDVHRKLKKLKECKRILLETQHEYADAVSQWQNEIVKASTVLCKELNDLREENVKLVKNLGQQHAGENVQTGSISAHKLNELMQLSEKVKCEYHSLQRENLKLQHNLHAKSTEISILPLEKVVERLNEMSHFSAMACQEYGLLQKENIMLREQCKTKFVHQRQDLEKSCIETTKLNELHALAEKAGEEYKNLEANLNKSHNEYKNLSEKFASLEQEYLKEKKIMKNNLLCKLETTANEKGISKEKTNADDGSESNLNLKAQLLKTQHMLDDCQQKYKHKEIEHSELIEEMRELNEALKARGDLISRQHEEYQILKGEFKTNSDRLCNIQVEIDKKDDQLNQKQNEIETITGEVVMTKQKLKSLESANSLNEEKIRILGMELDNIKSTASTETTGDLDNQSDVLSTSTISKSEEVQRLKDVEDSFEDKYNKLRSLAAKLKKKLQEETILKQKLEKEVQNLKKQETELNKQISELEHKTSDWDSLHKQLSEKQKHVDSLKAENQKLKSSCKQVNVLNLEIEAAEKSLSEVTTKLANRTLELETAQESLGSKDATITQLRKEIDLLETSKSAETKHSQELKLQIDHLHKALKDEIHNKQQAYDKSKFLEQDVENLKLELEHVKMELSQFTSQHESVVKSLTNEREQLSLQLCSAQATLSDCERKLKQAERATEELRVEYLDYKVKAQSVLRQNQNRDSSKERELEEELLAMRAAETRLNTTVQTLTVKVESLEKQNHVLSDDNANLQKHIKDLMTLADDMRTQNDALNQDIQQHIQKQHESLKQHRQQIESINNSHKEQIESLNLSHQTQLEQLRKQLVQHIRLPVAIGANKSAALPHHSHADHSIIDQGKLDFLLMEREDAEGSDEAAETLASLAASRKISNDSTSAKRSLHDFMPLDELLNTPLNAINSETLISNSQLYQYTTDGSAPNSTDTLQLELNSTKERLQKQESRVRHLTALLAENEQDLAKLTQMNDMLKEELRRQERSVEREQHLHNSEYVKNVIMKFLTLNNVDEKIRLVPVLNTILKLSRPETELLNCVAKGQKVSESTQRSGGWTNFLTWSGNN